MFIPKSENAYDANAITRAYMDSLLVEARYLDSTVPDTSFELYGRKFSSPVMIAAFSHLDKTHEGGMVEMARGAALADVCNWAGMGSETELENIRGTGAETIKIIKPYADRERVLRKIAHAEAMGCMAVGMDIDHSFGWHGEKDRVLGDDMEPVTTEELKKFVSATKLPFVIKGVLSVQDALKCAEAGVRGILLSHHHGVMPFGIPPLMLLPQVRKAVGDSLDLFVDCSIDTGFDAFKAIALGAKAVCVGRAALPAFQEKGAEGVAEYVKKMTGELRGMMAKTCAGDLASIDPSVIWDASTGRKLLG